MKRQFQLVVAMALFGLTLLAAHAVAGGVNLGGGQGSVNIDLPGGSDLPPLAELPAGARLRLSETLRAWLDHQGRIPPIAEALHVHPQTVRYRLGRLRELFGAALEDPQARFELELALRGAENTQKTTGPAS